MNTFQSTIASPRNQRILFWVGLLALVAGVVVLVVRFVGGSDSTQVAPSKGFKAQLPPKSNALVNANGVKVTSYADLDSGVKQAIVGFVGPGVINGDYGASWKYTAPNFTHGLSQKKWAALDARSIIPLPGYTLHGATYKLKEATTKEILVEMGVQPKTPAVGHPQRFMIGLVPYGKAGDKRWLVNYWMSLYAAKVPYGGSG
jgi:hypothetical protein